VDNIALVYAWFSIVVYTFFACSKAKVADNENELLKQPAAFIVLRETKIQFFVEMSTTLFFLLSLAFTDSVPTCIFLAVAKFLEVAVEYTMKQTLLAAVRALA
jgi:hypothetical protein